MHSSAYYGVCLYGFSIRLRILILLSVFSIELLVGLPVVDGIHLLIVGVSPQMIVYKN